MSEHTTDFTHGYQAKPKRQTRSVPMRRLSANVMTTGLSILRSWWVP
jgi:hypothetical protein